MRISALPALFALILCLCASVAFAQQPAADPAPAKPAAASAPAAAARSDAAEARYRNWVEKEHAKDDANFVKGKTKIEDKYKGYVRPPHEKKTGKSKKTSESTGN